MLTVAQLDRLLHFRIDAACLAVLGLAACGLGRWWVRRRHAEQGFPRETCALVALLVIAGSVLAEWVGTSLNFRSESHSYSLAIARAATLAWTAFLIAVVVTSSALFALMRAQIHRHAETERALERAKAAADEANRAKSDFLAVMSHEIRTPLNAVMGFAHLLAETRIDDTQRGYLATITAEGTKLSALINDVLDLSKIEEGRLTLERLPFAPVETAHEVLRLLSARASEKKISLRFEAQIINPLLISGDALRFRQILINLVDNAIKFTPQGSVTVFLTWQPPASGTSNGLLGVRVVDTGIGIPAPKQAALFKMFVQADASTTRRFGGTGLGLAICQRLVALMGGDIALKSSAGHGAEFSFTLPAAPVAFPEEAAVAKPSESTSPKRRPRILIVDDMETNRFLLEVFLQRHGYDPELAGGGEEAVRLAHANRYDAILMDLHMPDLDGFTATQRIRAAEAGHRHTPIIALTASIGKGVRDKCLSAGMDEHLSKPLDLRRFDILLANFVAHTRPSVTTGDSLRSTAVRA